MSSAESLPGNLHKMCTDFAAQVRKYTSARAEKCNALLIQMLWSPPVGGRAVRGCRSRLYTKLLYADWISSEQKDSHCSVMRAHLICARLTEQWAVCLTKREVLNRSSGLWKWRSKLLFIKSYKTKSYIDNTTKCLFFMCGLIAWW